MESPGGREKEFTVETRSVLQIVSTAALAAVTLANAALAGPVDGRALDGRSLASLGAHGLPTGGAGQGEARGSGRGALGSGLFRVFHDADGPRVRLEDGKEFRLLTVPDEVKKLDAEGGASGTAEPQPSAGALG